jgi:hypothetical protein
MSEMTATKLQRVPQAFSDRQFANSPIVWSG